MINQPPVATDQKELPDRNDKHYQVVREIFDVLQRERLTVKEAYVILDQVNSVIDYTPLSLTKKNL